jgi:hypothetical protein
LPEAGCISAVSPLSESVCGSVTISSRTPLLSETVEENCPKQAVPNAIQMASMAQVFVRAAFTLVGTLAPSFSQLGSKT